MPDLPISNLPPASVASQSDILPIVQGGTTDRITAEDLGKGIFNFNLPLTASGGTFSGNIVPTTPRGATLGTADKPFREIFVQSGSISIESDTPGDPPAILSNFEGNVSIRAAGFSLTSASVTPFEISQNGVVKVTGSLDILGPVTASLQQNYLWLGNSNNRSTPAPISTIIDTITSSFFNTGSFGFYGAFCSTASQTNPVGGVSRSIQLETTEHSNGVYISSGSRITVQYPGTYNLQFSTQLEKIDQGVDIVYIWFKKNGSNIARSTTSVDISKQAGGDGRLVAAWNYVYTLSANDYLEIVWQSDDINLLLVYEAAHGNLPDIPSVIATLTQVR